MQVFTDEMLAAIAKSERQINKVKAGLYPDEARNYRLIVHVIGSGLSFDATLADNECTVLTNAAQCEDITIRSNEWYIGEQRALDVCCAQIIYALVGKLDEDGQDE